MKTFHIPLRIVFYKDEGQWIAHCLEFDLCGDGATKPDAAESLLDAIRHQVDFSLEHNNPQNLFSPAPGDIQEMFFAGKHTAEGGLALTFEAVDHVIFEDTEYREYSDDYAGTDPACVPA